EGSTSDDQPVVFFATASGALRGYVRSTTGSANNINVQPGNTINSNTWRFIQFVRDVDTFKLFLDGAQIASETKSLGNPATNTSSIGALRRASVSLYAQANIAGAIKHSRALTLAEH